MSAPLSQRLPVIEANRRSGLPRRALDQGVAFHEAGRAPA